jgi:hypothetical protein
MGIMPDIPQPKPLPVLPDAADEAVQAAATNERRRSVLGSSRKKAFQLNLGAATSPVIPQVLPKTLLGQ